MIGQRHSSFRAAFAAVLALLASGPSTVSMAGPVRFVGGDVTLTAGDGPGTVFPLAFPGTGGHSARSDSAFAGETRVLYDLHETPGGASFEVSQDNTGDTDSAFTVTFATTTELHFRFYAEPRPYAFSARFDDFLADAFYNPMADSPSDIYRGSLVHLDGETGQPDGFEGRLFEGELDAGTHTLTVFSNGGVDRETVIDGGGMARLTLDPGATPGPLPVPLPPGALPALLTLLGAAAICRLRNARR